jgi:hypothetical protein
VYVYDARRDSIRQLFDDAIGAWHVASGHVLYLTSAGALMAARWDNDALKATSTPVPVLDGIQAPGFHVANDGTAYYLLGRTEFAPGPVPNARVVWVDRSGRAEPVDSAWQVNTGGTDNGSYGTDWGLALSPDGQRVALSLMTELGTDVWIKSLPSGPMSRLTLHAGMDRWPSWTADGRAVTFLSDRPTAAGAAAKQLNVWEQAADGTSDAHLLWVPDARRALTSTQATLDSVTQTLARGDTKVGAPALSPDGHWLAYLSNEQGSPEVFVRPYPNVNSGKWQVSSGGGSAPLWAHSGRELFYVARDTMRAVRVATGASFSAEPARVLFAIPARVRAGALASGTFAISPDDQRFLMVRDNIWKDMAGTPTLVVVQNLLAELRAKVKP